MTESEFEKLGSTPWLLSVDDLSDRSARTLLFGYTVERHTWHVYLDAQGLIHRLRYSDASREAMLFSAGSGPSADCSLNEDYVPNKRLYPESCDEEFCQLLKQSGVALPFTTRTEGAHARRLEAGMGFAGAIRESLPDLEARYLPFSEFSPMGTSTYAGAVLLQQAALELGVLTHEDTSGLYVSRWTVAQLRDSVDHQIADLATRQVELPEHVDDAVRDVQHILETLGCFEPVVGPHDVSFTGGVLRARVRPNRHLCHERAARLSADGQVHDLGHGAWRLLDGHTGKPLALVPAPVFGADSKVSPSLVEFVLLRQYVGDFASADALVSGLLGPFGPRA